MESVVQQDPPADLAQAVGFDGYDYADTFAGDAPASLEGDIQRITRRFVGSAPAWTLALLVARDRVARLVDRDAERHAIPRSDEPRPVVVGERLSMFRIYRVDADEVVIGDDERLMRYRLLLRLDPGTGRLTCSTAIQRTRHPISRIYMDGGLWAHRWFVKSTMRRFSAS